jgi:hypothetical protein
MLGVQRPTITNAAGELEREGLIERGRRQVAILNRPSVPGRSINSQQGPNMEATDNAQPHRPDAPQAYESDAI